MMSVLQNLHPITVDKILIIDFGSQYTRLIARRVREAGVYCEIYPFNKIPVPDAETRGVILSGSPASVNGKDAPSPSLEGIRGVVPLLGVCYGAQLLAHQAGGQVESAPSREYGRAALHIISDDPLFKDVPENTTVWMSHGDSILRIPDNFRSIASTSDVANAAFKVEDEPVWGLQFHPEVHHTDDGALILRNFVKDICSCSCDWTADNFIESTVESLKSGLEGEEVILGLSGGVDSSVAALLLHRAIGDRLHCIFVDSGLLRKDEFEEVLESYAGMGLQVEGVRASERFLKDLEGVCDPERKRKIIGRDYVEVFAEAAKKYGRVTYLAQGTIYPDVIESAPVGGNAVTIKSHHNVGGLPEGMPLKVVEPLRLLFKDEVRRVGKALGLVPGILGRHPFPGPGLGIRVLGEVTAEKVRILQEADAIFISALRRHGLYDKVWQAGAILLPVKSVGVMGDERTYENCVALRAVSSVDGMTADWVHLPYELLSEVSSEIINKVRGVNRVVYDISSKPPSTIEWE